MRFCLIVEFAVPNDHRIKIDENEKRDKYLDLARELKIVRVTEILIVTDALGTIPKGLVRGLEKLEIRWQAETIQSTVLRSVKRDLLRLKKTWYPADSSERPSAKDHVKNSQGIIIIRNNRPNVVVKHYKKNILINISVPKDNDISVNEYDKISKYKELKIESEKIWHLRTISVPVIVGALGQTKKETDKHINKITCRSQSIWNTKKYRTLKNCSSPKECTINVTEKYHKKESSKKYESTEYILSLLFLNQRLG